MESQNIFETTPVATKPQQDARMINVEEMRAMAEVQSALVIAKKFPRDPIKAMDRILNACTRPSLAEHALYQYTRGSTDISGPSIRLMEVVAQNWGNIITGITELVRRHGESDCMAYAWDLETNFRDEKRFTVKHQRDTKSGGHKVEAERDIYEVIANQGARRKRACLQAIIAGDITESAVLQCEKTLKANADTSPEALKKLVEAFAAYKVTKEQIEKRIQRHLDAIMPAQLITLRKIYLSLKDGMSGPADWFDVATTEQETIKDASETLKEKIKKSKEKTGKSTEAQRETIKAAMISKGIEIEADQKAFYDFVNPRDTELKSQQFIDQFDVRYQAYSIHMDGLNK